MSTIKKLDFVKVWNDFREGDKEAFALLFETFSDSLYKYGMKFIPDEEIIKDCIQDLFVKLYNNRSSLSSTTDPKFYLLLSLKNLIIDTLAKNKRLAYIPSDDLPFIATYNYENEDDHGDVNDEVKAKFEQVLGMLNPRQKEAIYLRFQQDLSYDEIAQLLGINYQSARNLVHRSITKIRENVGFSLFIVLFLKAFI